jgi:hypothetical protein
MRWRILSAACVALLVALAVLWVVDGQHVYTKTAQQVTVTDELFGTESVVWEAGLWIGLDVAGPCGGLLAAVAAFGLIRSRRRKTSGPDTQQEDAG